MIKISQQQVLERFDSLSDRLKEVSFSPTGTQIIQQTGEESHLTQDRIDKIFKLVGYALFGFIHPEDLGKEIRGELSIAPEIANLIANEIDRKIFAPIQADLEKNYLPAVALAEEGVSPTPEAQRVPAEPPVPPENVIDLKGPKIEPALPAVPVEPIVQTAPTPIVLETQRIPEEAAGEPAPVIIHKETEFRPVAGETTKRSLGGIFGFMTPKEGPSEPRPVTARIEMMGLDMSRTGAAGEPAPVAKTEPPKIRVVHYTDFRTPISPFGAAQGKPFDATQGKPFDATQGKPFDATQGKPFDATPLAKPPVSAPTPPPSIPVQPPSFEPLRKPEEIKPFEPAKPSEPPKAPEPPKKDEGDIIDLRTFEKIK